MKKTFTFLTLIFTITICAQITPILHNQNVANYEMSPNAIEIYNNEIYIPDFINNRILKTSATTANAPVNVVVSNLRFPSSLKIIGNELFFLQSITTNNPTSDSGKLSKIDLTETNPNVVDVITGLNVPFVLTGSDSDLFITEIIGNFTSDDLDDFDIEGINISKIALTETPSKTVLLENRSFILDMKWDNSMLYWIEEFEEDDQIIKYPTDGSSTPPETFFTFDFESDEFAERLFILNDKLLYTSSEFDGNTEIGRVKAIDFDNNQSAYEISSPFEFASSEVYAGAMAVLDNTLFVSALSFSFNTGNETELLYTVDLSTLSVENIDMEDISISFFPNPAIHDIQFSNELEELFIFDISGKKVANFNTKSHSYNVSSLSEGVYILKGKTTENKFFHKKMIKN